MQILGGRLPMGYTTHMYTRENAREQPLKPTTYRFARDLTLRALIFKVPTNFSRVILTSANCLRIPCLIDDRPALQLDLKLQYDY